MRSEVYRWQAAMGALAGALVAEAQVRGAAEWGRDMCAGVAHAEALLGGHPLPVDLAPTHAIASAVHWATGPGPLLSDPATVGLVDLVRDVFVTGSMTVPTDPLLRQAAELARGGFDQAVREAEAAGDSVVLPLLTGALVGLSGGIGAVPARPVSMLRSPSGRPGRRRLCSLTNRLLGIDRPLWYDPRNRRGPREVLPGLWLANLLGVGSFLKEHPDGLVLSLCDDEGRTGDHRQHITFHLEDTPKTDANPCLNVVVDEVFSEIVAARDAGQPVLLHCRHGASRTGLILRLLLVSELNLSADEALSEAQCLWPHTSTWNADWTRLVEDRAVS